VTRHFSLRVFIEIYMILYGAVEHHSIVKIEKKNKTAIWERRSRDDDDD